MLARSGTLANDHFLSGLRGTSSKGSDFEALEDYVRELIAKGVALDTKGVDGWTPLHRVAEKGDVVMCRSR